MAITSITRDFAEQPNIVRILSTDTLAVIGAAGYLTAQAANIAALNMGPFQWVASDVVLVYGSDGWGLFSVNSSFTSLVSVVSSAAVNVSVPLTSAQFKGMEAAPVLIVPAPGANQLIILNRAEIVMTYGTTAYTAGGPVAFQWGNTAAGAGPSASNAEAAADFFATASTTYMFNGNAGNTVGAVPFSTSVNQGIYLSNTTAPFATGDSTFVVKVQYRIIAVA